MDMGLIIKYVDSCHMNRKVYFTKESRRFSLNSRYSSMSTCNVLELLSRMSNSGISKVVEGDSFWISRFADELENLIKQGNLKYLKIYSKLKNCLYSKNFMLVDEYQALCDLFNVRTIVGCSLPYKDRSGHLKVKVSNKTVAVSTYLKTNYKRFPTVDDLVSLGWKPEKIMHLVTILDRLKVEGYLK